MQKPNCSRDRPFLVAWQECPGLAPCSVDLVLLSGLLLIRAEQGFPHGGGLDLVKMTPGGARQASWQR